MGRRKRVIEPIPQRTDMEALKEAFIRTAVHHGRDIAVDYTLSLIEATQNPDSAISTVIRVAGEEYRDLLGNEVSATEQADG